jgi:hypothetical protein
LDLTLYNVLFIFRWSRFLTHDRMWYVLTFINKTTHFCWIYFFIINPHQPSLLFYTFSHPLYKIEASSTLKSLSTNWGQEYISLKNVIRFLSERGIIYKQTVAHSSVSNDITGRNRTFFNIVRFLIINCIILMSF